MKKTLITLVVLGMSTLSANAFDRGDLSLTLGVAANTAVYGASGTENNKTDTNTQGDIKKEHGVFTDGHQSMFMEANIGQWVSLGYEHTPDSISTPENKSREGINESKVSVDFNDLDTAYLKLNTPYGIYAKFGVVETDLDIKETMASGRTYSNVSTEGTIMGLGYSKALGERGFAIRVEGTYMTLDSVNTDNGVSATGGDDSNGGQNKITVDHMEGLNAKVALTFTFGG